jgi:23S rRNA (pseudouridine1915-N3)-methyltransferase
MPLALVEVAPAARRNLSAERARHLEGERLLAQVGARDRVLALDVKGRTWSTETLARKLDDWRMEGNDLAFLIGGADGLDGRCLDRADERLSLSALTFPHALVRVIVAEQLYRAWTLLTGHPYHRA